MAHTCFGAHMQRVHAAGMASYPWHVEEDYRQDLTYMLAHAHSEGSFRQGTAARHMIPRLAGIAPRSKKDKAAIVKEFIIYYDTIKEPVALSISLRDCDCDSIETGALDGCRVGSQHDDAKDMIARRASHSGHWIELGSSPEADAHVDFRLLQV